LQKRAKEKIKIGNVLMELTALNTGLRSKGGICQFDNKIREVSV
jgi:hypothetical protein